jgi:ATP-binding cassette subfamily B multidrug efflux pump
MVFAGTLGAGGLISYVSYVFQILMSVMMISMIFVMAARAQVSAGRIMEVLKVDVDIVDPPLADAKRAFPQVTAGKVEFRDVAFKYSPTGVGEEVLSGISFTAEPGEVVGIVGGTGSGKSTLVHLIPRLYDISAGAVLVDGCDVREYTLEELRDGIGVVL